MSFMSGRQMLHSSSFLLATLIACAPRSLPPLTNPYEAPSAVAVFAGCWRFIPRSGHESHMPQALIVRLHKTPADTFRLYTLPALIVRLHKTPADTFRLYTLRLSVDTPLSARDRFGRWGLIAGSDQIFASWGDGLTGLYLELTLEMDTLRGRASRTTDFPTLPSGFAVKATRISCPNSL